MYVYISTTTHKHEMSRILVHSSNQRTDILSVLAFRNLVHTACEFVWKNPSEFTGIYRLRYIKANTQNFIVTPNLSVRRLGTKTHTLTGLKIGDRYQVRLERLEEGKWIHQSGKEISTPKLVESVSTSSFASVVKWTGVTGATYRIQVFDTKPLVATKPIQQFEQDRIANSGSSYNAIFSGLKKDTVYHASIYTNEPTNSSGTKSFVLVKSLTFETSDTVNLELGSIFATYVDLSWDGTEAGNDEEDSTGEFGFLRWERINGRWSNQTMIMNWTPDTTKSFRATGLKPGTDYVLRLVRRGVDLKSTFQSQHIITTATTDLGLTTPTASTRGQLSWEPMYEGAKYQIRYTGAGQTTKVVGGSAGFVNTSFRLTSLTPGTLYNIELRIVEDGIPHLVSTLQTTTDVSTSFSVLGSEFTSIKMSLDSPTADSTSYHFRTDIKGSSGVFVTSSTQTETRDVRELSPGTTYKITLFRFEHNQWVRQEGEVTETTKSPPEVISSIASGSALFRWDQVYDGAPYQLQVLDGGDSLGTYEGSNISTGSDGKLFALVNGLSLGTRYTALLKVREINRQLNPFTTNLRDIGFTTSEGATLQVGTVLLSSVQLLWSLGDVKEEDGIAEFRIRQRKNPSGEFSDVTPWIPDSTTSTTITGLEPSTSYRFGLDRLGLDGQPKPQVLVDVVTLGDIEIRIEETNSTSLKVSWDEVYEGAQYVLVYTEEGGSPVTFAGGPIVQTGATLAGLRPETNYRLELYIIENDNLVGSSSMVLGTHMK